jgi:hypothetical protein
LKADAMARRRGGGGTVILNVSVAGGTIPCR